MRRFKNIICVIEGDLKETAALRRSMQIAERNGAELTVHYSVGMAVGNGHSGDALLSESWEELRREWDDTLSELVAPARERGVPVEVQVHGDLSFIDVIRRVMRHGHDLLIKNPQSTEGLRHLLFGSTDLHLLRKCPCPVWIHKGEYDPGYRRITAAVDVLPQSENEAALNRLIMDLATSLADIDDSLLHAVHGWTLYGESTLRGRAFIRAAEDQIDDMLRTEMHKRRDAFDDLLAPYRDQGHVIEDHLIKGDARIVIPEFTRNYGTDLVVMGTVARTGLSGFLIGNTAEDIIRQVDCSVLAVKPEGFVSPVSLEEEEEDALVG